MFQYSVSAVKLPNYSFFFTVNLQHDSHHTLVLMPSGMLFTFGRDAQAQASGGTENSLQPVRLDGDWISSGAGIPTSTQGSSTSIYLSDCFAQSAFKIKINITYAYMLQS